MNPETGTKSDALDERNDLAFPKGSHRTLRFADFEVDLGRGELRVGGKPVALRPKSFALLVYLARHPGRLLTKDELIEQVWPNVVVTDDSLVQCVSDIRAALGDSTQRLIKTVPRRGYLLDAQPLTGEQPVVAMPPTPGGPLSILTAHKPLVLLVAFVAAALLVFAAARQLMPSGGVAIRHNTIAILSFETDSGDEKAISLAEAITEDLVTEISRLPDTLVIAHNPQTSLANDNAGVPGLGRRLGVTYVLTGKMRRDGEAVSIAVKLQSSETGALVWADRFDYPEHGGWNWRRDITARIANHLSVRIDQVLATSISPYAGRGLASIDPTLKGWHLLRRIHTREHPQRARALFEQALQADPESASALTGLALSHITEVFGRWSKAPETQTALAASAIDRALTLQPHDVRAIYVRSLVLYAQGRIDDAVQATERVLLLYPHHPRALQRLGFLKVQQGYPKEAEAPVNLALRLDRFNPELAGLAYFTLGLAKFHMRDDVAAYAYMRQSTTESPDNAFAWQWFAALDALNGRSDQARANLAEYLKRSSGHTIGNLKASELSRSATFWKERNRFYEGLRLAGLPE
jgi:DNA-binding winged helix-turn-helix (wHTH) protein/TolB-like protein/Tfp pilus assembly protein PilF